jgi:hypothetical protein
MTKTGWIPEEPAGPPAMPLTALLLGRQQNRAGPLEIALARSRADDARAARDEVAFAPDPDERSANLLAGGYQPGLIHELSQRLGDVQAELETERDKVAKGKRRAEIAAREHAAGRVDVFRMQAMMDGDFGDEDRVQALERRAQSLGRQLAEAQNLIAPPQQRDLDPVEQASRAAHEVFREVTRARWAEAQSGSRPRRERPPFDSGSRGRSTDHVTDGPCWVCEQGRERDAARAREDAVAVYGEITRVHEGGRNYMGVGELSR